MFRHATETYYQNKIERLEASIAKKEALIKALEARLSELPELPVDNKE